MKCNFFTDWLCRHDWHDFKVVASWISEDKSLVIMEEVCTRCKEDAYSIISFNPSKGTTLVRSTNKLDSLQNIAAEELNRGRREEDWTKENKKERKPVTTTTTKRAKAKKEAPVKN